MYQSGLGDTDPGALLQLSIQQAKDRLAQAGGWTILLLLATGLLIYRGSRYR